ncbi:hypothetical protein phiAS5_ORF0231 [Aeromonas phage phiAS5]|uniref:Uncharacterized protein n=1 Tax=Aeromonas phage phiAS5 TaxID=879630 RepID=E1A1Y5_9CAUD|nr:hypothetical protein phiAS5_ORF0231 [Aeromonas phage phiAS5]ADM80074.1 hypothetical protein phiAS5_ORF0231 [Aeromonas phage phiAS5]BES53160.1 hypothetical protein [Aeromonas phage phiWae14]
MQNVNHKHKVGTLVMVTSGKYKGVFGKIKSHGKSVGYTVGTKGKVYPTYAIDAMWYMDDTGNFRRLTIKRANNTVACGYAIANSLNNLGETQITEVLDMNIITMRGFVPDINVFTGGAVQFVTSFPYMGYEFPVKNMKMGPVVEVKPEPVKIETKIAQASGFDASEFYIESDGKMVKATEDTIREIMKTHKVTEVPVYAMKKVSVFDLL